MTLISANLASMITPLKDYWWLRAAQHNTRKCIYHKMDKEQGNERDATQTGLPRHLLTQQLCGSISKL